ncbi:hypothetical protein BJ508DRAFT_325175 [Ascobolus immersus RN42]|uniref:Uncharacterized protein n=1 Tax=Ascobolus immersus RN42 TaxID=1160509 RepID=A0A3N4IDD1_ASCIM|nr:hypothetical protein BJ508DRAFT_325175 [Ascobolus immersus RN42]
MLLCRHRRGFKQAVHIPEGPPASTDNTLSRETSHEADSPDAPSGTASLSSSPSQASTHMGRSCGKCKQSLGGFYDCNGCGGSFCESCKDKLTALRGPTLGSSPTWS